jgi:putative DNA primase/helicase
LEEVLTLQQWVDKYLKKSGRINSKGWQPVHCPLHEDTSPSSGVNLNSNVFNCYKCGQMFVDQLAEKMGVEKPEQKEYINSKIEVARYDYKDRYGKTIFQMIKYLKPNGGKTFLAYNPNTDEWTLKGVDPLPYRLPELLKAIDDKKPVYIAEGEKDVDTLYEKGFTATTNSNGSKSTFLWRDLVKYFPPETIIYICPDADSDGVKHAETVADILLLNGCNVRIIDFGYEVKSKDKGGGQDVSDWFLEGHTITEFIELCERQIVNSLENGKTLRDKFSKMKFNKYTDIGNSDLFKFFYGDRIRWCDPWKKWLIWNNCFWEEDRTRHVVTYAKSVIKFMEKYKESIKDIDELKALTKWVRQCESYRLLTSMIECVKNEIAIIPEVFDKNDMKLNCPNGIIDLQTGLLLPSDQNEYMTRSTSFEYHPEKSCPRWLKFLDDIMLGRKDLVDYLQKVAGYCLTGNVSERCFFILYGRNGDNGKTTFVETLKIIMGDYAKTTDASTIMRKQGDEGIRNDLARLKSARLVSVSETPKGKSLDENMIKAITGDERIKARFLYSEEFEFRPTFKFLIYTNHRPKLSADDQALWNRVKLIPFEFTVKEENKILGLSDILIQEEAEGILAWAVEGCLKWQKEKLNNAPEITQAINSYRKREDSVGQFLSAVCRIDINDDKLEMKGADLLSKYHEWVGSNKMFSRTFYEILQSHDIERIDKRDGIYLKNVRLLFENESNDLFSGDEEEKMRKAGLI